MDDIVIGKIKNMLRWVFFIPGALFASWMVWYIVGLVGNIGLRTMYVEPGSFMSDLYMNTTGHVAMGATFVYIGGKIVPDHKEVVAYFLGGLGLVLGGFFMFPSIMMLSGWAIWGGVWLIIGIGSITYAIHTGDIDLE